MLLNKQIRDFIELINLYWPKIETLNSLDESKSLKEDWLQANWELIVERPLIYSGIFLKVYGQGAECNGSSSRVLFPEKKASHKVILEPINGDSLYDELGCKLLNTKIYPVVFNNFVTF